MSTKCRTRSANFTLTEKELLKELVREFSHTLNKKKVDKLAWREKHLVWDEICTTFNDISTVGVFRSKESLKKLYDNHLRKDMSDDSEDEDDDDYDRAEQAESRSDVGVKSAEIEAEPVHPNPQNTTETLFSNKINEETTGISSTAKAPVIPHLRTNENDLCLQKARLNLKVLRMEFERTMARHDLSIKRMKIEAQLQQQQLANLRFENEVKKATLDNLMLENGIKVRELEELRRLDKA